MKAGKAEKTGTAARTAILSGSFDPVTEGHRNLARRAEKLFGRVVVLVARNSGKTAFLPDDVRLESVRACLPGTEVLLTEGLLAEAAARFENPVIVRGARDGSDFAYEWQVAAMNRDIGNIDTVVLPAEDGLAHVSSTYARDLIRYGKTPEGIVPEEAWAVIRTYLEKKP
ncbi:MAG: pantetheine-phosphate adenylyltransferase [Clostridia bacterium]|nr:pantetheine-phosphate adenylyltransferase [Clostridia bacterium]